MNKLLVIICAVFGVAMAFVMPPDGAIALLVTAITSFPALYIIRKYSDEKDFLTNLFLTALIARLALGIIIQLFDIKAVIAEDTTLYDLVGWRVAQIWHGISVPDDYYTLLAAGNAGPNWGMYKLVGAIYYICGRSLLAAQAFCAVVGAATAPMVFYCSQKIFNNRRVAKNAALLTAFFPAFIIWSGQLLKDGLIVFLLVVVMIMAIELQKKMNLPAVLIMMFCMIGIMSLRFYIFYMVAAAVAGSFVVGLGVSVQSIVRNVVVVILIGLGLTYLGIIRTAQTDLDTYANLERLQLSRDDQANNNSGYAQGVDITTTRGAVTLLPIGFAYLMFAPFPWEVNNFRQIATLPEVLIWWAMMPLLISGLLYTLKNRLRIAIPVLIFALMLTLAYSLFQGNVGTAYRQRTQIQVFLFIFISVGWTLWREKAENRALSRKIRRQEIDRRLRAAQQTH